MKIETYQGGVLIKTEDAPDTVVEKTEVEKLQDLLVQKGVITQADATELKSV